MSCLGALTLAASPLSHPLGLGMGYDRIDVSALPGAETPLTLSQSLTDEELSELVSLLRLQVLDLEEKDALQQRELGTARAVYVLSEARIQHLETQLALEREIGERLVLLESLDDVISVTPSVRFRAIALVPV